MLPLLLLSLKDLIVYGMWMSEGFISLEEGPAGEYYIGPSYYIGVYILRRNLIEPNQYKGRGYSIMHDVIRSFGQYMAK
jgi:hypothetical protein